MDTRKLHLIGYLLTALLGLSACALPDRSLDLRAHAQAVVADPSRSGADQQIDARRHPVDLLVFAQIEPGLRVLDLGTELLARAVAPGGVVYGQDAPPVNERAGASFNRRMGGSAGGSVVRLLRPFDDPLPEGSPPLDRITLLNVYHDLTFRPVDRERMNQRLFAALRPGGLLVVSDHSAQAGAGAETGRRLHRIDEGLVRREIEAAGFRFVAGADFLRRPEDSRTERISAGAAIDEFVIKFVRP